MPVVVRLCATSDQYCIVYMYMYMYVTPINVVAQVECMYIYTSDIVYIFGNIFTHHQAGVCD